MSLIIQLLAQKVELPADFDVEQFLKVAEANFAKMQKAWDTGNVTSLSDFTTAKYSVPLPISCVNEELRIIRLKL